KVDNADFSSTGPVYKGLAFGSSGVSKFVYAANFRNARIDVFDGTFTKKTLGSGGFGTFTDAGSPALPAGYAPFGIANIGGNLFVTYALQDATKHDNISGPGDGFVSEFDTTGHFIGRITS